MIIKQPISITSRDLDQVRYHPLSITSKHPKYLRHVPILFYLPRASHPRGMTSLSHFTSGRLSFQRNINNFTLLLKKTSTFFLLLQGKRGISFIIDNIVHLKQNLCVNPLVAVCQMISLRMIKLTFRAFYDRIVTPQSTNRNT